MENQKLVHIMPAELVTTLGNSFAEEAKFRALEAALKINQTSPESILKDAEEVFQWLIKNPTT